MLRNKFQSCLFLSNITKEAGEFWKNDIITSESQPQLETSIEKKVEIGGKNKNLFKVIPSSNSVIGEHENSQQSIKKEGNLELSVDRSLDSSQNCTQNTSWTRKEDELLLKLCFSKHKKNWNVISNVIGNKSANQCATRFKKLKIKNDNINLLCLGEKPIMSSKINSNMSYSNISFTNQNTFNTTQNESDILMKISKPSFTHNESNLDFDEYNVRDIIEDENMDLNHLNPPLKGILKFYN
jgi:hypothetical protein